MGLSGERQQRVFQHVVQLFQHEHLVEAFHETLNRLFGERIGRAYLHEPIRWHDEAFGFRALFHHAERLAGVRRRHASCHDAEPRTGQSCRILHWGRGLRRDRGRSRGRNLVGGLSLRREHPSFELGIELREGRVGREVVRHRAQTLVDFAMRLEGPFREDDPAGVALEAFFRHRTRLGFVCHVEERGGMVDARRRTHDDRRMSALGEIERGLHHRETLLRRGRVEHGHLGERGEPARVLLGLRRYGTGIVGHEQHGAALHPHVVQAHERVAGHVEAHLLAGEQHARATVGRSRQQFERRFLVRGPFDVHSLRASGRMLGRDGLDELRRRGARIARHHAHARLERCVGESLVPHQQFFCHSLARFFIGEPMPPLYRTGA